MPTAARLMAALCLAATGYFVSNMVMLRMPEDTEFGYFVVTNMALGFYVGWSVMGTRAGRGIAAGVNNGLTGVLVLVFWGIAIQSVVEMLNRSMDSRFDGVVDAFAGIFEIWLEFALIIATLPIGIVLVSAALISGLLTEFAAKRWR